MSSDSKKEKVGVHGHQGVYCGGDWIPIEECEERWSASCDAPSEWEHDAKCSGCPREVKAVSDKAVEPDTHYDVIVIGVGCVGACITRELAKHNLRVLALEAADDVSQGPTKANSGIVHAGYDDKPGSRRAQFCWKGNQMYPQMDRELHFGFIKNGSLVVARGEEDEETLEELVERGKKNGVKRLKILNREELLEKEPYIDPNATAALWSPDAGTVTPYEFTIAVAENAADNGVDFKVNRMVNKITGTKGNFTVRAAVRDPVPSRMDWLDYFCVCMLVFCLAICVQYYDQLHYLMILGMVMMGPSLFMMIRKKLADGTNHPVLNNHGTGQHEFYTCRYIVNSAGLWSDRVAASTGKKPNFKVLPRSGEYLLLHKDQGKYATSVLFPCPGKLGKGIVAQPTLWGNLLLGPTARDLHNPEHMKQTTKEIMTELIGKSKLLINGFDPKKVIHSFAGQRAKSTAGDWVIEENDEVPGMILACAIDSPGLAASPAIADYVVNVLLKKSGLTMTKNKCFNPYRLPIVRPKRGWLGIKIDHKDPEKNVVCKCEKVTEAEIVDALGRSLECRSTQAVRKRTRAGMGHCQGEFCEPRVTKLIAKTLNISQKDVPRRPWPATSMLPQRWPTDEQKSAIAAL